jgi:hypothetical protein
MDLILTLAVATFVLVVGFLLWNRASTKKLQQTGGNTSGIGGPNDPLAGATEGIRDPDVIRADLDAASSSSLHGEPRLRKG